LSATCSFSLVTINNSVLQGMYSVPSYDRKSPCELNRFLITSSCVLSSSSFPKSSISIQENNQSEYHHLPLLVHCSIQPALTPSPSKITLLLSLASSIDDLIPFTHFLISSPIGLVDVVHHRHHDSRPAR